MIKKIRDLSDLTAEQAGSSRRRAYPLNCTRLVSQFIFAKGYSLETSVGYIGSPVAPCWSRELPKASVETLKTVCFGLDGACLYIERTLQQRLMSLI